MKIDEFIEKFKNHLSISNENIDVKKDSTNKFEAELEWHESAEYGVYGIKMRPQNIM